MRNYFIAIILSISAASVFGQSLIINNLISIDSNYNNSIGMYSNFESNSSGFTNSFLNSFFFSGEFIESSTIQNEMNQLKDINYAGSDLNSTVYFQKALNQKFLNYLRIELNYRDYNSAKFSGDFMKILLQGNSVFEDQTAEFNDLQFYSYSAGSLGFYGGKNFGEKLQLDIGVEMISANRFQQLSVNKGSIYTSPYGEYISGDLNFDLSTATGKTNLGLGASLNLNLNYQLNKTSTVGFNISDLGTVRWKNVQSLSIDTTFQLDGFVINNVFDSVQLSTQNSSPDSLQSIFGITETNSSKTFSTPYTLGFQYTKQFGSGGKFIFFTQWMYYSHQIPLMYGSYRFAINESTGISPNVSFGGFGSYNIGCSFDKSLAKKLYLKISTRFIDGLIFYKTKGGQGGYISLVYCI